MTEPVTELKDNTPFDLPGMENFPVSPAHGISAVALNLALKWFDITMIKDGVMYQQKKMDGSNIISIDLSDVLEVAKKFELHIMSGPSRLSGIMLEAFSEAIENIIDEPDEPENQALAPDAAP